MDIIVRILNPLFMISLGLGLGVFLTRRFALDWGLYAIGAVTFIGSQVLHIPFNLFVLNPLFGRLGISLEPAGLTLVLISLALGLSAGLFEEGARYLVYRFWIKDARSWRTGLLFGGGHGGAEAVLLGLAALAAAIQLIALQGTDLSARYPPEQLALVEAQVAAFWALPWYGVLLGTVERALALCIQLALSLLVLQAFTRKNITWLGLAIGWHTLVDALAVFGMSTWGIYVTEGLVVLSAVFSLWIIFQLRQPEPPHKEDQPESPLPDRTEQQPPAATREALEDSRYTS